MNDPASFEAKINNAESSDRFRFLANTIPHKVWTSGPDGKATYYNQGWYDYTGIGDFYALRRSIWEVLHPEDLEAGKILYPRAIETGEGTELEHRFRRYDGMYRWHLTRLSPHKNEKGEIVIWIGTSTDIHEQKLAQQALQLSEAHFKALTFHNSLPIWQMNAGRELIFVNDAWRGWSGLEAEKVSEGDAIARIHPEDRDRVVHEFDRVIAKRQPIHLKFRYKNAVLGEYRWILDNAQPVFNPEFDGYIGTMTDIHEQEQAHLTIQQLMKKKDDFFAIASHELKTPITSMKASLQILDRINAGKFDPGKSRAFIDMANKQVNKLMAIVSDLLDVSKLQSGKMQLNKTNYQFNESVKECVSEMMLHESLHEINVAPAEPFIVFADQLRIEQVITNLLSNAIKYSPKQTLVELKTEQFGGFLKCSVTDFGIGIPAAQQPFIFDRFYRVDDSSTAFSGLGLGLYISSEIIQKHDGKLGVVSETGKGSTFWFTLPLAPEQRGES